MCAPISKFDMQDRIKVMALVLKYFDIIGPCKFIGHSAELFAGVHSHRMNWKSSTHVVTPVFATIAYLSTHGGSMCVSVLGGRDVCVQ